MVIVGGGPAAVAAGIYAARKRMKAVLITESLGGQSLVSASIENWIGTKSVSGFEFAKMLEEHLRAQEDIEIVEGDLVTVVQKQGGGFRVATRSGKTFETKTLFVGSGSRRRKLGIPGEKEMDGKGVAYCATCDAPLFKGKVVAVVGGGNAGLEAVIDLLPYADHVYLLEFMDVIKGDPLTFAKVQKNPKVTVMTMVETKHILGDGFVNGLRYADRRTNEEKELELQGVFVEIGSIPNSDFVKGLVELNNAGEIIVDHKTQRASLPGIWAAGDVCDVLYKQNNISAGDAVKAVLNIDEYLNKS